MSFSTLVSGLRGLGKRTALVGKRLALIGALLALVGVASDASAFCGFFVTGANTSLYANATMVVLMHSGTRTVLSMQNNYQGPTNQFALVIPVPVVLQQDQVQTLKPEVFARVDQLGAPRLVEYWETDPCFVNQTPTGSTGGRGGTVGTATGGGGTSSTGVIIEAQFTVGEYNIVILSANDSSGLASWLSANQYNIPAGADQVLMPYVTAGMKFFVAKVDPAKVTFKNGQAALSPLRFYYDSNEFSLPVRLGLLNSGGAQDLIVNILAPQGQRYEVANYTNVTVPTNIRVHNEVRNAFGSFYEALFAKTVAQNPKTVVTEYAWDAQTCDPCPIPALTANELATLGADVISGGSSSSTGGTGTTGTVTGGRATAGTTGGVTTGGITVPSSYLNFTLTRLHYRYDSSSLGDDLLFRTATGIQGGRGVPDAKGVLDSTVTQASYNNFQGRYVILHPWEGAIACTSPVRGRWGGPPVDSGVTSSTQATQNTALIGLPPMAGNISALVAENVPAIGVMAMSPLDPLTPEGPTGGTTTTGTTATGSTTTSAGTTAATGLGSSGSTGDSSTTSSTASATGSGSAGSTNAGATTTSGVPTTTGVTAGTPDAAVGLPGQAPGTSSGGSTCAVSRGVGSTMSRGLGSPLALFGLALGATLARRRRRASTARNPRHPRSSKAA